MSDRFELIVAFMRAATWQVKCPKIVYVDRILVVPCPSLKHNVLLQETTNGVHLVATAMGIL